MKKTVVGVIGQGFVGGSLAQVLRERDILVFTFDKAGKGLAGYSSPDVRALTEICEGDVADVSPNRSNWARGVYFVCVPTPMAEDGSCDTSIVESVLDELAWPEHLIKADAKSLPERIAVIKSTVPPGSTKRWNEKFNRRKLTVVFSPEFLREASALDDMRNQDRIVLGGPKKAVNKVRDVFHTAFPNVPVHKTSSTNAEFVKYVSNCMLAIKVSFANELHQIVGKFDPEEADYDRVVELATLDKRLGESHWQVPGPMPCDDGTGRLMPGFSGSCFIKDINALMFLAKQLGVDPKVMDGAWRKNLEVRPERDWEKLVGRAVSVKKPR